jgi:hypothetical protein
MDNQGHKRVPVTFVCQHLEVGEVTSMTMGAHENVNDLCVAMGNREGVDPKQISILTEVADPSASKMMSLNKFETVYVLMKNANHLHLRTDVDDDSPSGAMSRCHTRSIQEEVPGITIIIEFMAPYLDSQVQCVVNGDKCKDVGSIQTYVSRMTAIIPERMFFYKDGKPLEPWLTLKEAGFDKITRLVMKTRPGLTFAKRKHEWSNETTGSPSRDVYTPDYSNSEADE